MSRPNDIVFYEPASDTECWILGCDEKAKARFSIEGVARAKLCPFHAAHLVAIFQDDPPDREVAFAELIL